MANAWIETTTEGLPAWCNQRRNRLILPSEQRCVTILPLNHTPRLNLDMQTANASVELAQHPADDWRAEINAHVKE